MAALDPNEIIGQPREYEVWLAPGWDDWKPITSKAPSGSTRVSVRETLYADGRRVTQVLNENRQPITTRALDQQTDKEQEKRFKDAQQAAAPPGGANERIINGNRMGWNPESRAYDVDLGAATSTAAQKPSLVQVEGTPDPSKPDGRDNDRPIMASHWPDGRVTYEPLTSAERTDWEKDRNRAAGQGPYTDTQIAEAARKPPQVVSTNTTEPYIVTVQPDGTLTQRPNPNYKGEPPKPGTNLHVESGGKHYIVPIDANGKAGAATVLDIPAEAKPGTRTMVDGGDGQKYIVTIGADNTVTTTDTAGRPVPGGVPPKRDAGTIRYNPDTGEYEQIRTDPATGRATVSAVPREGQTPEAGKGPSMPQLVVGATSRALTDYHTALRNDPSLTPAQRERRFAEAVQVGTVAANEARIQDAENQSVRGYNFNVADTKLNYLQRGLGQALDFVSKFNGLLPEGSDLGGKALGAMLGLQMLQMNASGINQLNPGGVPTRSRYDGGAGAASPPIPRAPTPAELNDPAALDAKRAEILAHPAFTPSETMDREGPRVKTPGQSGPTQPLPERGGVPVTSTPAMAPPSAVASPGVAPPPAVAAPPVAAPVPAAPPPVVAPAPQPSAPVAPPPAPVAPPAPSLAPPVRDDWRTPGPPVNMDPSQGPVGMAPPAGSEFAVLNQPMPPAAAPVQIPQVPTLDFSQSPALLRMKAQTSPPWRLDPLQIQQMIDAGVPESDIWSIPGQGSYA